jgi:nucleotide-binding universal stress UspA family protein
MLEEAAQTKLREAAAPAIEARLAMDVVAPAGRPWAVVCPAARDVKADLVVIGSRGLSGLERVMLGSTADRVLRSADVPVLTVHPGDERPAFRKVLFATDFSGAARSALDTLVRLVGFQLHPVELTLLHVSQSPYVVGDLELPVEVLPDWGEIDAGLARDLEALAETVRSDRLLVKTALVRGVAPRGILDELASRHPDLAAMGTQGRGAAERLLLGSVAERVLHHAECPVLTQRVAAARTRQASSGRARTSAAPA